MTVRPATIQPMFRQNIAGTSPWEDIVGFSRAVRAGDTIYVAGTIANDAEGMMQHLGDAESQCSLIIEKIGAALASAGATLSEVVCTRTYVTGIEHQEAVGRAHKLAFGAVKPASTLVAVSALASPEALVEMEAVAVLGAAPSA